MLSLWGRKADPAPGEGKSHYYSANTGQILSADGSGHVIPDLGSIEAEKMEYIPREFATQQVQSVVKDASSIQDAYKDHIEKVTAFYKNALNQSKAHYEDIVKDLKKKAQRHVEVNKQLRLEMEDRLNKELRQSEEAVEELRDDMARLNREYQDETRKLKARLQAAEAQVQVQKVVIDDYEGASSVQMALQDIKHEVERRAVHDQHNEITRSLLDQIQSIQQEFGQSFASEQQQHMTALQQTKDDQVARKVCSSVLGDILLRLEVQDMRDHLARIAVLQSQLTDALSRLEGSEKRVKELQDELSAAKLAHSDLSAQGSAYAEEIERISRQFEEEKQALLADCNARVQAASDQRDRAEVLAALNGITLSILQSSLVEAETEALTHGSQLQGTKSALDAMQDKHLSKLKTVQGDMQQQMLSLSSKHDQRLQELQQWGDRLEVSAVVERLVGYVAECALQERAMLAEQSLQTYHSHAGPSSEQLVEEISQLKAQLQKAQATVQQQHMQLQQQQAALPAGVAMDAALLAAPTGGDQSVASAPVASEADILERKRLEAEIGAIRASLAPVQARLQDTLAKLAPAQAEREKLKLEIKEWTRDFVAQNGRNPEVADKALIKDKYQRYKVSSGQSKELEELSAQLEREKTPLEEQLRNLEAQLARLPPVAATMGTPSSRPAAALSTTEGMVMKPVVDMRDAEIQVAAHELRAAAGPAAMAGSQIDLSKLLASSGGAAGGGDGGNVAAAITQLQQAHEEQIERLEDQLFDIKARVEQLENEKRTLQSDYAFVSEKLEVMIKEKRTDVLKRFEEELERLRTAEKELNEKVTMLQGERSRLEARVKEVTSRAELAEQELKDRDSRELAVLNPTEEKAQLKTTINKQRDQIVLKSKAATAGWDAAAKADEKIELEVQRAYNKGMKDERDQHKKDMEGLHQALEAKENRITELLTQITTMELTVKQSTTDQALMRSQMEALRLEVADAVVAIQTMGGGGLPREEGMGDDEVGLPPSQAELDSAREQLDAAQEELVHISERCDRLESELELARKKNRYYERLATLTGLNTGTVVMPTNGKNELAIYDLNAVINNIKKVIVKCTNLWKSNRKDECYDLYLEACLDAQGRLLTEDLTRPLRDSIEHGKNQGAMNKQRGAVVLRKALDKLLSDAGQPGLKAAEDAAVAALRSQQSSLAQQESENKEAMVQDLVQQLQSLESSLLEQGYTYERNPTNSSSTGEESRSPRGDPNASSLLLRAKAAENQVASLKKQMAAIISATAAQAAGGGAGGAVDGQVAVAGDGEAAAAGTLAAGGQPGIGKAVVAGFAARAAGGGGADPAEVRRLNRKIKDLEAQLKNANSGGGGGGAGAGGAGNADAKALQAAEKALQKKLKDQETAMKREAKALEMRATKAENALQKIQSTYNTIVSERDQLKTENAKLFGLSAEVSSLRAKAERCDTLDGQLATKEQELALLQDQFKKESALRKKYKNELEDLKGAIRVFARCRPMARYELEKGCKTVVEIKDETSMKVVTSRGEKEFEFDAVFSPTSTQDQVFEDTKRLVESCLDGFNVCLFAYGQTGSGKTFTMTGSADNPGLTPKAIDELFRLMRERVHLQIKVTTYFVELYNDNLVDLYWLLDNKTGLAKSSNLEPPKLEIKMDAKKMVFVRNAVIKEAASPEELMDLFTRGNVERHTGATKMNAESSRSHSIFAIMVESYDTTSRRTTNGKLSLVDLAGSERADKTGASAERLKEAQSINKSLSALGDVIAALSEGGGANKHIPYRNNKLTQLMQDSLGGNAKTLMFVNFSPADYNADETSTSLMYAARVKKIVNNASKQAESEEVARLKAIIKRLQGGQGIADLIEPEPPAGEEPVIEDDGKVYDGY